MIPKSPTNSKQLASLLKKGEGLTLEFKRSTGELKEGMQSVCAFKNGSGGLVLFGIRPDGTAEGQHASDKTLRDIAHALDGFEPPVQLQPERLSLGKDREILILRVDGISDSVPFTYEGRPFERVASTTRKMSQEKYEKLLLERAHARRRWENQPAVAVKLKDLDREEILRVREAAIRQRRISPETSTSIADILDRMGLRRDGVITQAAHVLFGKTFLPDYPQCMVKMGRFRGTTVLGDILDNRQEHLNAFALVREALAFLDRTLPLSARFPKGTIQREDRLPVPPEALREILLNAVMHRDYTDPGGFVAIAVFDDRIEIRSAGSFPPGISVDMLSGPHLSKQRNPLIADAFHRTGDVEIWGRGTNRVIEACRKYGITPPLFEEKQGWVVVTFRAPILAAGVKKGSEKTREKTRESAREKILGAIRENPSTTTAELAKAIKLSAKGVEWHLKKMKIEGVLKRIGPDKGGRWELS
ncbi:MAG TPA: ATP-binding protein [Fibrobacteria bacterium]|nr:ATP-binding protein [Fibrobacteria bacterium]